MWSRFNQLTKNLKIKKHKEKIFRELQGKLWKVFQQTLPNTFRSIGYAS